MKRSLFVWVLILMTLVGWSQNPTYYLNPDKKLTQYNFNYWTTDDGLPTNSLLHIHQARDGFLWITGYSGLIRFDGSIFKLYNNTNVDVLKSNVIRGIAEDSKGNLWFTSQGNGLIRMHNGDFQAYGVDQDILHLYRGIYADKEDRIWTASPEAGWFYLENGRINFIKYHKPLQNIEVRAITQSKSGAIWFATLGEGLFKYENGKLKAYTTKDGLTDNWIYSLFVDKEDNLWIGTSSGICYFDGTTFKKTFPEIGVTVNKILKDHYGNFWIGTIEGLYREKANNTLEFINSTNGLPNNFIIDFLFDTEGNMWLTHYKGGLAQIKDGKFTNYTFEGGLPGEVVNTVCEINDESFLVGFDNGKLVNILNGTIKPYKMRSNFDGNRVRDIQKDSNGNLWFSTYLGLLKKMPDGQESWYSKKDGFDGTKIRLTYEDSKGNIWVGTRNNGLVKIEPDNDLVQFDVSNGLSSNLIMSVDEDKQGNIWVGTSEGIGGLNSISATNVVTAYTKEDGFRSDIVFNITPTADSVIWFATITGIWAFKDGQFFNITTKNGLEDNSVFDLIEDGLGNFWIPFAGGLMKVEKQELEQCFDNNLHVFEVRTYDKFDGMPNSECNPTAQVTKGSNGKLYFPTLDGLSVIDPSNEMINNCIPPVYIESITVDNQKVLPGPDLHFPPGKKRYTFGYTALSLYEPKKVSYEYQLVGFETEWTRTSDRSVSYTNLPHGSYEFRVRACNNDDIWNLDGTKLNFIIKNRFTESVGFYILILIVSFSLVYVIYVWRISQLKNRQETLEKMVNDRNHEVIEKNKTLEIQKAEIQNQNSTLTLQKAEIEQQSEELERQKDELKESIRSKDKIFSIISHDLRSPLGNIQTMLNLLVNKGDQFDADKKSRILENLAEITKSTYYLLDNLLSWSRSQRGLINFDPQMFLVAPIVNEVVELVTPMSSKKNIEIISRINESDLAFGDLNMVKTIFRNLIENALKFTYENGKVEIFSTIQGEIVEFGVKDSGVGMSEETVYTLMHKKEIETTFGTNREKGSGLGLLLCKEFIQKNNGNFRIESEQGKGSTIYFSLKRFQI